MSNNNDKAKNVLKYLKNIFNKRKVVEKPRKCTCYTEWMIHSNKQDHIEFKVEDYE